MIALSALAGSKRYVAYADARLPVAHLSSPRDNLYEFIQNPFRKERVLFYVWQTFQFPCIFPLTMLL